VKNDGLITSNDRWNRVIIEFDAQRVAFFNDDSIGFSDKYTFKRDTLKDGRIEFKPNSKKTTEFKLSREERDSLYLYVNDLIRNPIKLTSFCTDYVGNVTFKIQIGHVEISSSYSSICSFDKLGQKAMRISAILSRRIDIPH
jgi:hypothetical protein